MGRGKGGGNVLYIRTAGRERGILLSYLLTNFSREVLALLVGHAVCDGLTNLLQDGSTLLLLYLSAHIVVHCPALPFSPGK